ncbi:MAG: RNA 2',3'-cyclic phosphodiesterase, partial [Deltaproteobacteria bacterium]|nr:RNA 2',3'-cyclic phosphodiesterase [Deltaproteobacteria bacterium]
MIRAFLALDISDEVKKNLADFIEPTQAQTSGIKWVEPKNYHVTFKFFGNVDEEKMKPRIERIVETNVGALSPVSLSAVGIGCFPKWEYPRVIWAGLQGET